MKKLAILGLILLPLTAFGAVRVVKEYGAYDFIAHIQTTNSDIKVYKVEDTSDPLVSCYVLYNPTNFAGNGADTSISCVKAVK